MANFLFIFLLYLNVYLCLSLKHKICAACKSDRLSKLFLMANVLIMKQLSCLYPLLDTTKMTSASTTCASPKKDTESATTSLICWRTHGQGDNRGMGGNQRPFVLSSTGATASSCVFFLFHCYLFTFINTLEALTEHHPQTTQTPMT